jgi:molecular chaperone GrpE
VIKIPIKKPGVVMSKSNGQADLPVEDQQKENLEHELPAADPTDGFQENEQSATATAPPPSAEAGAEAELRKLRSERDNLLDRLARLQAEFDNSRKRAAKENADYREYAVADAARGLLPVLDSFERALKSPEVKLEDLRKGMELIRKQFEDTLQRMNVQRIPAEGQPFDPRVHEAIEMVESNDVPDHHVLEVLQPGYRMKDRLLRPAMVRVAKNK